MNKKANANRPLVVKVFDVGHGESILIEFPDGKHFGIVDCQSHAPTNRIARRNGCDQTEPKVLSYVRDRLANEKRPDAFSVSFICLSHFHDDHYTGMGRLVEGMQELGVQIEEFWDPGVGRRKVQIIKELRSQPEDETRVRELERLYRQVHGLRTQGLGREYLTKPRPNFRNICGVKIDLLAPDPWHWESYLRYLQAPDRHAHSFMYPGNTNENLISSAFLLRYGKAKVLLSGELTNEAWVRLLANAVTSSVKSHAVKVSHHGARAGNFLPKSAARGASLWRRISFAGRTVAAISGGYLANLPHPDTLEELKKSRVETFCTGNPQSPHVDDLLEAFPIDPEARRHIQETSKPVVRLVDSLHGDITIEAFQDGNTKAITEFDRQPL